MKLSQHLSTTEMKCRCGCGICEVHDSIIDRVEVARTIANILYSEHGEIKVHVSSGCRCVEHNENEGGYIDSQHITIADFYNLGWEARNYEKDNGELVQYSNEGICRALDGYFYYTDRMTAIINHIRVDPAPILIPMYREGLIRGVVLYDNNRFHMDTRTGRKYFSDRRS